MTADIQWVFLDERIKLDHVEPSFHLIITGRMEGDELMVFTLKGTEKSLTEKEKEFFFAQFGARVVNPIHFSDWSLAVASQFGICVGFKLVPTFVKELYGVYVQSKSEQKVMAAGKRCLNILSRLKDKVLDLDLKKEAVSIVTECASLQFRRQSE